VQFKFTHALCFPGACLRRPLYYSSHYMCTCFFLYRNGFCVIWAGSAGANSNFASQRRIELQCGQFLHRGGRGCRYRSPNTDPDGTADETAIAAPTGLRVRVHRVRSPDGTDTQAQPKSGVGVVGRAVRCEELNCNCNPAASRNRRNLTANATKGGAMQLQLQPQRSCLHLPTDIGPIQTPIQTPIYSPDGTAITAPMQTPIQTPMGLPGGLPISAVPPPSVSA
jgi:hypothetical protein